MSEWKTFVPTVTLRDYFAAAALSGLLPKASTFAADSPERTREMNLKSLEYWASYAYGVADAMLKARAEGGDTTRNEGGRA